MPEVSAQFPGVKYIDAHLQLMLRRFCRRQRVSIDLLFCLCCSLSEVYYLIYRIHKLLSNFQNTRMSIEPQTNIGKHFKLRLGYCLAVFAWLS